MPAVEEARLSIRNRYDAIIGELVISVLPGEARLPHPHPLLDLRDSVGHDQLVASVQLLESAEYRYAVRMGAAEAITSDHPEVFGPDSSSGVTGRLRPGLFVGTMQVRFFSCDGQEGVTAFEVRSRKIDYLHQYRWMLRDIAEDLAETVMHHFAPSMQRFAPQDARNASTLYQRFAFLQGLLATEHFTASFHQILTRPYFTWREEPFPVAPNRGLRSGHAIARRLAAAGPRSPWVNKPLPSLPDSIPARVQVSRLATTLDNTPNQFVKFALTRWRGVVTDVAEAMEAAPAGPQRLRGLREAEALGAELDALLGEEVFRETTWLPSFPAGNQVLQKRPGYRDVYRAYVQFEAAAMLSWEGGDDVYHAGQRDIAALYEYWTFLQLAKIVASLCSEPLNLALLLQVDEGGLALQLRRGKPSVLRGRLSRLGRDLSVELWFNRTFSARATADGVWSRAMRPDCSLRIAGRQDAPSGFEPIWLHFDAKYRIDQLRDILGADPETEDDEVRGLEGRGQSTSVGGAKRDDLIKMHAYRDAIKRSAGAYVLYPGTEKEELCRTYHELLPGLGAFALRPTEGGQADGAVPLAEFLDDVFEHVASQLTQHERARYWSRQVYEKPPGVTLAVREVPFLSRPPADTPVLLGYVKSVEHLTWIEANRLYNLRADGRPGTIDPETLMCQFLILYGEPLLNRIQLWRVESGPNVMTRLDLTRLAYPDPRGALYHCLSIELLDTALSVYGLSKQSVSEALATTPNHIRGAPVVRTWQSLVQSAHSL